MFIVGYFQTLSFCYLHKAVAWIFSEGVTLIVQIINIFSIIHRKRRSPRSSNCQSERVKSPRLWNMMKKHIVFVVRQTVHVSWCECFIACIFGNSKFLFSNFTFSACDACEEWYHGDCIQVTEKEAKHIKHYYCMSCKEDDPSLQTVSWIISF